MLAVVNVGSRELASAFGSVADDEGATPAAGDVSTWSAVWSSSTIGSGPEQSIPDSSDISKGSEF